MSQLPANRANRLPRAILALLLSGFAVQGWATQRVFPGPAPCDTTLQACINAAAMGDTIDIATNQPIDEQLSVSRSLTLRPAPGFAPVIGGSETIRGISLSGLGGNGSGDKQRVLIEGLSFVNARMTGVVRFGSDGHQIELRQNRFFFDTGNNNTPSIDLRFLVPVNARMDGNHIVSSGQGIKIRFEGGPGQVQIVRNTITTSLPAQSNSGVDIGVSAEGDYTFDVISNVIHSVGGCRCGFASGLLLDLRALAKVSANISQNTVYDAQEVANGINVFVSVPEIELDLSLFNNTVSSAANAGYRIEESLFFSLASGGNNSFANGTADIIPDPAQAADFSSVNPRFLRPGAGDFQLREDSALIDAGVDTSPLGALSSDAAGLARPAGGAVDVGALEFDALPVFLIRSRDAFLALPAVQRASSPYPNVSDPGEPFASGAVVFDTFAPSSLNFGTWPADFPDDNNIELALNDAENLIVRSSAGPVLGMGIDFNDATGGSSPSTFVVELYLAGTQVGRQTFRAPNAAPQNFVGVWSPVPFDELRILERPNANENEYFGAVFTTSTPATRTVFTDGLEGF